MTHRVPTVRASREAHAALRRLVRTVGPLVIVQSAGCCDGSAPMVLPAEDFPLGAADVQVGDVDGVPVFISARELNAWAHGDLELDVQPGYADGFSLAPSEGMHFISSSTACPATPKATKAELP